MNSDRLIEFMEQLIKNSATKLFLILDNLRVNHSKPLKEWLEKEKGKIEAFYLLDFFPDSNPDEYLNCNLKQGMSAKPSPKTQSKLSDNVENHM